MTTHSSFYVKKYLDTISTLKKHDLWDLEHGMLFLPLIQHCMPHPSINQIYKLLEALEACEVDTDWAPHAKVKKLKRKVSRIINDINSADSNKSEEKEIQGLGKNYPVAYGIQRINNLLLSNVISDREQIKIIKRNMIITFVEFIYSRMAAEEELNNTELYQDIYQIRDVIIDQYIKEHRLNFSGGYKRDLEKKRERVSLIVKEKRKIGSYILFSKNNDSFWDNPPHVPFSINKNDFESSVKPTRSNGSEPEEASTRSPSDEELLRNNTQQRANLNTSRVKWARSNVRSLADANQLSFSSIFSYWEYLLAKNEKSIFLLSVITFLTGIQKKRWLNCIKIGDLTAESLLIHEDSNAIEFKLISAATQFDSSEIQSTDLVLLNLPFALKLTNKIIAEGVRDESRVRAFNRLNSGPSLTLNNVARSGHNLLRKLPEGETLAFFLTGRTPVEFRNRSAYLSTDNQSLNELLNSCLKLKYQDEQKLFRKSIKN